MTGTKMAKKGSIIILILVALTSLLIGTQFGKRNDSEFDTLRRKKDSLTSVIKNQQMTITENAVERDSARKVISQLKKKVGDLQQTIVVRANAYQRERTAYREKLKALTEEQLASEARRSYIVAHPAPLFDTTNLGPPVAVEREPVIHLLEQDKKALHLEKENADLRELDTVRTKQISNMEFQITKYQSDSAACKGIIGAQEVVIETQKQESDKKDKQHKKELRKEKIQKWAAIGLGILSILSAIAF